MAAQAALQSPAGTPNDRIFKGSPIYDGDWVTLRNEAWKGTTIKRNGKAPNVTAIKLQGGNLSGRLGATAKQEHEFSWSIRSIEWKAASGTWMTDSLDFTNRKQICYGKPFVLFAPGADHLVMATEIPSHMPTANNGDYRVKQLEYRVENISNLCKGAQRAWTKRSNCLDFIDASTRIWYFEALNHRDLNMPVKFGDKLFVRNMFTMTKALQYDGGAMNRFWNGFKSSGVPALGLIGAAMKFNGGRNLTQASGSDGATVKLALSNHDSDDKSRWVVDAWLGNNYPVRRSLNARPLQPCRPGNVRDFTDSSCRDPVPGCPAGSYFNQDGECARGACPSGDRDAIGYCNDPAAPPMTATGAYNVFHKPDLHTTWLAQQEAAVREQERQQQGSIPVPPGYRLGADGQLHLIGETPGSTQLDTNLANYRACNKDEVRDPLTGACLKKNLGEDLRSPWEKLWYWIFGYNWSEHSPLEQQLIIFGLIATLSLLGYGVVSTVTTAVTERVVARII